MRRPRGSLGRLLTYYYFPTGAPGTVDGGEEANWFSCRYGSYILSAEYKSNQEKFGYSNGYWSDWIMTETGVPPTPRMPALGSKDLTWFSLHARLPYSTAGWRFTSQVACTSNFFSWKAATTYRGPTGTFSPAPGTPDLPRRSQRWALPTWDLWTGWSNHLGWWNPGKESS